MKNTRIKYMYRDASNYKFVGDFIVQGELSATDIEKYLHDSEFFIPHEVGLDHLLNLPMNQDDHYLHTFEEFQMTLETKCICTASEFVERMKAANSKGWFSSFDFVWQQKIKA